MKRILPFLISMIIVLPCFHACKAISSLIDNDKVIARVGKHKLTRSDIGTLLPPGTPADDSIRIVMQYINTWASDLVFADIAEAQLSKAEKDVTRELDEYRKALLKYRYEQRYLNERLDTTIQEDEVEEYYLSHKSDFVASVPVVKARFMRISSDSPNLEVIKKKMSSRKLEDIMEVDSLAWSSADKYTDYGMEWVDIVTLAEDFGKDYGSLLSVMRNSYIQVKDEAYDKLDVAYIDDFIKAGDILPLEYCSEMIKNILVGVRKHRLVQTLETDLLQDAREKGNFVIY